MLVLRRKFGEKIVIIDCDDNTMEMTLEYDRNHQIKVTFEPSPLFKVLRSELHQKLKEKEDAKI